MTLTLCAAAAAVGFIAIRDVPVPRPMLPPREVAVVDRIEGVASVAVGDRLRERDELTTGPASRMSLRLAEGTSLRVDVSSRLRIISARDLELSSGAVYLDTEGQHGFAIRTPTAIVRDIGTQFEVRVTGDGVRLRVRSGIAELRHESGAIVGRAGTQITLSPHGADSQPIPTHGSEWDWTGRVAPRIEIEGVTLATFLDALAREQGWTLAYSNSDLAREAARTVLHGSVDGLAPADALHVAMLTSGLRHRLEGGALVVLRGDDR